MKNKCVIDADNMKLLEKFSEEETDALVEKYKSTGRWNDISVDLGGDIILWERIIKFK